MSLLHGKSVLIWLALAALVSGFFGCTSSKPVAAQDTTAKPIDRVYQGLVDVQSELARTTNAAEAIADGVPNTRSTFSLDLRALEQRVQTLKSDAAELRDRADGYLATWSGQTYVVTGNSTASTTDPQHQAAKAKYDQFVAEMIASKEAVLPLLDTFVAIEKGPNRAAVDSQIQLSRQQSDVANRHLSNAVGELDELKKMVQANRD